MLLLLIKLISPKGRDTGLDAAGACTGSNVLTASQAQDLTSWLACHVMGQFLNKGGYETDQGLFMVQAMTAQQGGWLADLWQ